MSSQRFVTFRLGADLYALRVENVERVLRYEPPRRVPGAPAGVEGILDVDGRVIPMIDLRRRLDVA